jgi:hypothetical protein
LERIKAYSRVFPASFPEINRVRYRRGLILANTGKFSFVMFYTGELSRTDIIRSGFDNIRGPLGKSAPAGFLGQQRFSGFPRYGRAKVTVLL